MAKDERELFEVLRSVTASAQAGPKREEEPPHPDQKPPPPPRPAQTRVIQLGLEEVGVFFFAAVLLVVLAFLMGWYGRGAASGAALGDGRGRVSSRGTPRLSIMEPAARDLGTRGPEIRGLAGESRARYAILVAVFPPGGSAEADDHRRLLEERGYVPAWPRRSAQGVELWVGRFESPTDPLARKWITGLAKLRPAYSRARILRIP